MTKHPFFTFALLLSITLAQSQVKVGENPQNIDASSLLELESTSRALVISRMNTSQMNAINPLEGALVFNTEERCVFYYSGSAWINLCSEENTTNVELALQGSDLILTDSDGNTVSVALEGAINQTFSTDPVENFRETIIITQTGDNFNFEVGEITGEQIADFTIQGVDFAPDSITEDKLAPLSVSQEKLQENAVADFQLDYNQVTLNDFTNDAGFITNAQIISPDAGNVLIDGNGAFYDNTPLLNDIANNDQRITDHLNEDNDIDNQNELISNAEIQGNELLLTEGGIVTSIDLGAFNNTGSDNQNLLLNGNLLEIDNATGVDLTAILRADNVSVTPIPNLTATTVQIALEALQIDIDGINAGGANTDEQTLATDGSPGDISISNGGAAITLNVEDGDSDDTNEIQNAAQVAVAANPTNYTENAANVEGHLEGIDTRIGQLTAAGGSDGVVTGVALTGTNLNFTGTAPGFIGSVPLASINTNLDEAAVDAFVSNNGFLTTEIDGNITNELQDLNFDNTTNILTISNPQTIGNQVDLSSLAGGAADGNDFITGGTLTGQNLNLTGTGGAGAIVDLTPFALDTDLVGFLTVEVDGSSTNELQDLNLNTNILTLSTPASPGNQVDLTPYLDNQIAIEVDFTASGNTTSVNVQDAIQEIQTELDGIVATGTNPNDELITTFNLIGTTINIAEGVNIPAPIDLDPIFVTEAELTVFSVNDGDFDPINEIQDLNLNVNSLELSGDATPVDLTPYLDNTDAQVAAAVPVVAVPANYTAATPDVEAHLIAIDTELGNVAPNPTDELQDLNLNVNSLELSGDATPVDLTPYLDNTDAQVAAAVPVVAVPANYTAATPDVEAHLIAIDTELGNVAPNPTDELQDLNLNVNSLELSGDATPVDLTPYLDNTDAQVAAAVPVAAVPANYTAATPDVEAHLIAIDTELGNVAPNPTDELQDLNLNVNSLELSGDATPVDLTPYLDNTDAQVAAAVPVAAVPANYTAATPDVEAHLIAIDTELGNVAPNPTDELQDLNLNVNSLELSGDATPVDLTPYLDNTDAQVAAAVPVVAVPANYTAATPDVEAHLIAIDTELGNVAPNPTDELQDLNLNVNSLELSGDATPVDLTPYLDNTDAQVAAAVPVVAVPANYTAATPDVEAHLIAIDTELGNVAPNPTDELQDLNLNVNSLELSGDATPVDLTPYLDNTDAQVAAAVPVVAVPANYTAATPDVEAHLIAIDTELGNVAPNPTDELQDLNLNVNSLELSGDATPVDLTPYLDNTDAQVAAAVPVAAVPANYTAATPDVEAHLTGLDAAIAAQANTNFAENDLQLDGARTHDLNGNNLVFDGAGNIGIGNLPGAPQDKLDVDGQIRARNGFGASNGTFGLPSLGFYNDPDTGIFRDFANQMGFSTGGTEAIRINASQIVGIGTGASINANAKLHVNGNIYAENGDFYSANGNVIMGIPDYVFQNYFDGFSGLNTAYDFKSLSDIEKFVRENKHLPGVTSATQAKKDGHWNLSQSNLQNLEKIEELFLHTIEQEKKIESLKSENEVLNEELQALKKDMELIKTLLIQKQKD